MNSLIVNSSLLIDKLLDYGVTYSSITLLDKNGNSYFSKSSSDKWLDLYINSGLYLKCHLMQEAFTQIKKHNNGFTFIWDKYAPFNEESVYLNKLRDEKNITHGVAFCSVLPDGCKSIITVTGKYHDINFSNNVLRNKKPIYKAIMHSLNKNN